MLSDNVEGCITDAEGCCDDLTGSGGASGSGGCADECFQVCDQCAPMSASWTLGTDIQLCRVEHPSDGNYCRFVSADLSWELKYEYGPEVWALTNLNDGRVWITLKLDWACAAPNVMHATDAGESNVTVTPDFNCTEVSYDCVSGGCIGISGTGGTYPTLEACEAACRTTVSFCGRTDVPNILTATLTVRADNAGCCLPVGVTEPFGAVGLVWDAGTLKFVGTFNLAQLGCTTGTLTVRYYEIAGVSTLDFVYSGPGVPGNSTRSAFPPCSCDPGPISCVFSDTTGGSSGDWNCALVFTVAVTE